MENDASREILSEGFVSWYENKKLLEYEEFLLCCCLLHLHTPRITLDIITMEVEERKQLPSRANRGNRLTQLIQSSLEADLSPFADDELKELWAESDADDDFSSSDAESDDDEVDSDFDLPEDESGEAPLVVVVDADGNPVSTAAGDAGASGAGAAAEFDADAEAEALAADRSGAGGARRRGTSSYIDPAQREKEEQRRKRPRVPPRHLRDNDADAAGVGGSGAAAPSTPQRGRGRAGIKRKDTVVALPAALVIASPEARALSFTEAAQYLTPAKRKRGDDANQPRVLRASTLHISEEKRRDRVRREREEERRKVRCHEATVCRNVKRASALTRDCIVSNRIESNRIESIGSVNELFDQSRKYAD